MTRPKMSTINFFLATIILILGAMYFLMTPLVSQKEGFVYNLERGTSKKTFINDLYHEGLIKYPNLTYLASYFLPHTQLKSGEYLFPAGSNLYAIWKQVTNGSGLLYHPFTIIPGWSFNQLRRELTQNNQLRHDLASVSNDQVMKVIIQHPANPEGMFFPDTYHYTRGNADIVILKKAYDLMQTRLSKAWESRVANLPYTSAYEALIAASLIEKEAHFAYELPIIAGVLVNRLRNNMLLQFDPTVIYGMGDRYQGKIHKENLSEDTLYNTYLHRGLPPTPIAMPSLLAIEATLHPQQHDYFYFVAKGDGSHVFSKTLEEHNTAVNQIGEINKSTAWFFNESIVQKYLTPLLLTKRA